MLFARSLSEAEAAVRPVWLDTVVAKFAAVDTMRLYDAALVTVPQVRVGEVEAFDRTTRRGGKNGTPGAAMIVVKLHAPDQALMPPTFAAFTSQ